MKTEAFSNFRPTFCPTKSLNLSLQPLAVARIRCEPVVTVTLSVRQNLTFFEISVHVHGTGLSSSMETVAVSAPKRSSRTSNVVSLNTTLFVICALGIGYVIRMLFPEGTVISLCLIWFLSIEYRVNTGYCCRARITTAKTEPNRAHSCQM